MSSLLLAPAALPTCPLVQRTKVQAGHDAQSIDAALRALLSASLGLPPARIAAFREDTELFGALAEFDSMAVAAILTGIEDEFHVVVEDDEVEAEDFLSYGRLLSFTQRKLLSKT